MKKIVLLALLALALPLAAFAGNVDFQNAGGMLSGSSAGLTLTGSELVSVTGFNGGGLIQGGLGTVSFTTAALTAGNLQTGATFAAGGTFVITGDGSNGIPNGVLFNGTFSGPVTWTEFQSGTGSTGSIYYTLQGSISGTYWNGSTYTTVNGATIQITFNAGVNGFQGSVPLGSGDTVIGTTVPEPGTLGLLGTGLVGLAGVIRKKLKA
ncbi:MAG TPA: PEP-CTERM sorting domain-containing protein [Candidatus Binatia bacterium]|nr:PEP-CTERM sorting domain-containing protein [Candidatus Binatia bacterium]